MFEVLSLSALSGFLGALAFYGLVETIRIVIVERRRARGMGVEGSA